MTHCNRIFFFFFFEFAGEGTLALQQAGSKTSDLLVSRCLGQQRPHLIRQWSGAACRKRAAPQSLWGLNWSWRKSHLQDGNIPTPV